jgi:hypothetical protein
LPLAAVTVGAALLSIEILCSVGRASLYKLVNYTKFVHNLFSVYFVNFVYNLYMLRTSPRPSSGGTTVFMRHLVLIIPYSWLYGIHAYIGLIYKSIEISLNFEKPDLTKSSINLSRLILFTLFVYSYLLFPFLCVFFGGLSEVLFYVSMILLKFLFLKDYQTLSWSRNFISLWSPKLH